MAINLRRAGAQITGGTVLRLIVSIVSAPVLMRALGIERYGIWAVLNALCGMIALGDLGIAPALIGWVAGSHAEQNRQTLWTQLAVSFLLLSLLGLLFSVGSAVSADFFVRWLFHDSQATGEAKRALLILCLTFIPRFWQQWAVSAEAAAQNYGSQMVVETISAVGFQIGAITLAAFKMTLPMLAWFQVITAWLTVWGHAVVLKRIYSGGPGGEKWFSWSGLWSNRLAKELLVLSLGNWARNIGQAIFSQVDRIIVTAMMGPSASGLYSAATSVATRINELSGLPMRVLPAAVGAAVALKDQARLRSLFERSTHFTGMLAVLFAGPLVLFAQPLALVLVGAKNAVPVALLLRVLGLIYGLFALNSGPANFAMGMGKPFINARWVLAGSLLMCAGIYGGVLAFGLIGAAWGNAGFLITLLINVQVMQLLGWKAFRYFRILAVPMAALVVCFLVSQAAAPFSLWWQLGAGVPTLFIVLIAVIGWSPIYLFLKNPLEGVSSLLSSQPVAAQPAPPVENAA